MLGKNFLLLGIFLLAASMAAAAEQAVGHSAAPSGQGVLLLRNGQVIEGHVERNGDYYTVTLPGQELQIHTASVEFCCRDLREGYQRKKATIQSGDVQQHLQLVLWCERHNLLDCAGDQLAAAAAIDPDQPMIAVLRRRLKIESQQKTEPVRPAENYPLLPSDEQLDHLIRGMPPGTVELFAQVVQPILLNHYPGARGYTLPDKNALQLMRPSLGEVPGRRITQRNLYAVLQCIDMDHPGDSPLLKASVGTASGPTIAMFPGRFSPQYQKIVQWVYMVAQKPRPVAQSADAASANGVEEASFSELASGETTTSLGQHTARNRARPHISYFPPARHGKERPTDPASANSGDDSVAGNPRSKTSPATKSPGGHQRPRRLPAEEAAAKAIENVDPYDPATFNNQSSAPTQLPTPAARVLGGKGHP